MLKFLGVVFLGIGIASGLREWVLNEKQKMIRKEEMYFFLQKIIYLMKEGQCFLSIFFKEYQSRDQQFQTCIFKVGKNLEKNVYPKGELAWQEAFNDNKKNLALSQEIFEIIMNSGEGIFGKCKEENIKFLEYKMEELKACNQKEKEKFLEQKKVWLPVATLGGVMLMIIFL